ncbi:glycosidase [Subsaximicrobium wynnwilliamsii]|uniref:Glycosidase n=1 Tax=Subsaximicrobium wynnwilliamsii TaxID=291179 RepID=A0A5C6ZG54_9FLAO|nr:glycosidase [Subsaximicrobium wynnwilliamsii]TXD83148.1 glycosidase [Subsaximicrobium wynnwilliamsii]TXD88261.1 glycosidase [Subsaximicrobium wynnwilliamsii]TXE02982.1 glycosidase [Subsaximicrobium wynnwilliamsii]
MDDITQNTANNSENTEVFKGVMLNAYPDSIGNTLSDAVAMLKMPAFKDVFSMFYVLPTFFNSDLDRGFSIVDYDLNETLVSPEDLAALDELNIMLKLDIVLNHISVASPQFKDVLQHGEASQYKDFFINWNEFWEGNGTLSADGVVIPDAEFLNKLFMRKPGLPVLNVLFPDGSEKPFWNTFYQSIHYHEITIQDLKGLKIFSTEEMLVICEKVNSALAKNQDFKSIDFGINKHFKSDIIQIVKKKRTYLGQMDVNAKSDLVWNFYEETLSKLNHFGCKILRLDAFAYLHKQVGQTNFFNKPGTWDYLERIKKMAERNKLMVLPEIHAEYGLGLHDEVAKKGFPIYDFFLPGLMIHTLENGSSKALISWVTEIIAEDYKTVNMLGCHDGIPVLDLKGKEVDGTYNKGLLEDADIEAIMETIIARGGRVKNLYDPAGRKISYYQVNATFFSALGEDERKLLLARAIQMFMPGIPQVWYLDLFAGKNNYEAADQGGSAGHKEINRSSLTMDAIEKGLKTPIVLNQLKIMRLRNTSKAFLGMVSIKDSPDHELDISWTFGQDSVQLKANLKSCDFTIDQAASGMAHRLVFQD